MDRRMLVLGAALGLAAAVACGQSAAPSASSGSPVATSTGIASPGVTATAAPKVAVPQNLTVIVPSIAGDLNPYNRGAAGGGAYLLATFDALATLDSGKPERQLAASWRNLDPLRWEVKLVDAKYSNGETVSAEDVKFSWDNGKDPRRSAAFTASFAEPIDSIEVVDPKTVIFRTKVPDPILLNRLSGVPILPKAAFERVGIEAFFKDPIGVGPFTIKSFTPQQTAVIQANPNYWGPKAQLSELTLRAAPEPATRVAAIRAGEADLAQTIPDDLIPQLQGVARSVTRVSPVMTTFYFDTNVPEWSKRESRLAFNAAIDRATIVKQLYSDITKPAQGQVVNDDTFGFNPAIQNFRYDEAEARRLLAAAGYASGFQTKIGFTSTQALFRSAAESVTPYLARVGIRAELSPYDSAQFLTGFRTNQLGPLIISAVSTSELLDASPPLSSFTMIPGVGSGRYKNPDFDRLFTLQAAELDSARRQQQLRDIMKLVNEDAPVAPMWVFWNTWAVTDKVAGFQVPATGFPNWSTVSRVR